MEVENMPFVAVIGGLWLLDAAQLADAKAVGEQIGEELAKAGFGLVVYFSNDESLEPHVIAGYARALPKGKGRVRVRFAESQRGKVKFKEETTLREIFEISLSPDRIGRCLSTALWQRKTASTACYCWPVLLLRSSLDK